MKFFLSGADFIEYENQKYLVTSSSFGRMFDSKIYIYKIKEDKNGNVQKYFISSSVLPPMAEEICFYKDKDEITKLAILNESFSKRYQIDRPNISPNGISLIDFEELLRIKRKEKLLKDSKHFEDTFQKQLLR